MGERGEDLVHQVTGDGGDGVAVVPAVGAPSIIQLLHQDRLTAHVELPASDVRAAVAQAAIASLVQGWQLPPLRSQRWLVAADAVLAGPGPLEMYVQLDHVSHIVTLELWQDGAVVFGIDDWIGF